MAAIEFITSAERIVRVPINGGMRSFSVLVWNPTIANLTLMALGSSAPEILLSVIEITSHRFYSGELGPSTIVGSAAFNLMVITAICILAIPAGQARAIKELGVFYVTAAFSLLAYAWLYLILVVHTPNIVQLWEGLVTFALFPLLLLLAYLADIKAACFAPSTPREGGSSTRGSELVALTREGRPVTLDDVARAYKLIDATSTADDTVERANAVRDLLSGPKSRAFHRLHAAAADPLETADAAGGGLSSVFLPPSLVSARRRSSLAHGGGLRAHPSLDLRSITRIERGSGGGLGPHGAGGVANGASVPTLAFETHHVLARPSDHVIDLVVRRTGRLVGACTVQWQALVPSVEEAAKVGGAAAATGRGAKRPPPPTLVVQSGALTFEAYCECRFVRLARASLPSSASTCVLRLTTPSLNAQLGVTPSCHVYLLGNHESLSPGPSTLAFESDAYSVKESSASLAVAIVRTGGLTSEVSVTVKTVDGSAKAYCDYVPLETTLTFAVGETRKEIAVVIIDDGRYEADEHFLITLSHASDGVVLGGKHGAAGKVACEVTIVSDETQRRAVDELMVALHFDLDAARLGGSDWCEQLAEALAFPEEDGEAGGGGGGGEDAQRPSAASRALLPICLYLLTLPFNLLFALPPPPRVLGGWACFVSALGLIGLLTALIGDLANGVGCCAGISPSTTAITLVALGTSLPDTFASMSAARAEAHADASIVNITGSNSVNVFLGLGLPWAVAAAYWAWVADESAEAAWRTRYQHEAWYDDTMPVGFAVPAGSLGTSVAIFTVGAFATLGVLMLRRWVEGHELGGGQTAKVVSASVLVALWLAYIVLSIALG